MRIKEMIKKMPGIRGFYYNLLMMKDQIERLSAENRILANTNIDMRLKLKKMNHEPINVVFVCHRPAVWASLKTVYEAMKSDEAFRVQIVAIPNKKEIPGKWLNHEEYESEGAEDFWESYGCILGYDYGKGEWLDLKTLEPDYVFFQQPYNITRCAAYKSNIVSKYAKIGYVNYFGAMFVDEVYEECTPLDYLRDLSYFFTQNENDDNFIRERYSLVSFSNTQIRLTGFPRYDDVAQYKGSEADIWNKNIEHPFRIVWTPRWTTNEGNCNFFEYKDLFVQYCEKYKNVDFVFRPHPQAFQEWETTGELSHEDAKRYLLEYEMRANMHLDRAGNYYPLLYSSDCLITDKSTIILDYFLTGKPIVFCKKNYEFDGVFAEFSPGLYITENWEETERVMQMLQNGSDPLMDKRKELIEKCFYIPNEGAGNLIKETIKADALK